MQRIDCVHIAFVAGLICMPVDTHVWVYVCLCVPACNIHLRSCVMIELGTGSGPCGWTCRISLKKCSSKSSGEITVLKKQSRWPGHQIPNNSKDEDQDELDCITWYEIIIRNHDPNRSGTHWSAWWLPQKILSDQLSAKQKRLEGLSGKRSLSPFGQLSALEGSSKCWAREKSLLIRMPGHVQTPSYDIFPAWASTEITVFTPPYLG